MTVSNKTLPSVSVPFTDSSGRINRVWYEFLRSFVTASVDGTIVSGGIPNTIVAGNGLVGVTSGNTTTLRVGQGQGIAVNADDVAINVNGLTSMQPALDDEILVSDVSDNNSVKKTQVRNIVGLSSPGGSNSHVQYNNNGAFAGDSSFVYNGSGSISLSGLTINGTTFDGLTNSDKFIFRVPAGSAATHFTFRQTTGSGSSGMPVVFGSSLASTDLVVDSDLDSGGSTIAESRIKFNNQGVTKWVMGLEGSSSGSKFVMSVTGLNVGAIYNIDPTNYFFNSLTAITRSTTASITASTTQTQGQQPLTTDVNEISVCANLNDTVTLPSALAGRSCLVINNGAQTLKVFPASGDNLGAGLNTSTTIVSGSRKLFVAFDSTNWEPVI